MLSLGKRGPAVKTRRFGALGVEGFRGLGV